MNKFKVGERVVFTGYGNSGFVDAGEVGIITSVEDNHRKHCWVTLDGGSNKYGYDYICVEECYIKLESELESEKAPLRSWVHPWIVNTGERLVRKNVLVDVEFWDGKIRCDVAAKNWQWDTLYTPGVLNISRWRFSQ